MENDNTTINTGINPAEVEETAIDAEKRVGEVENELEELPSKNIEGTSGNIAVALAQDTPEKRSHGATSEESPAETLPTIVQHDSETFSLSTEVSPAATTVLPLETALTVAGFFVPSTMTFEEQIQELQKQPQEKVIEDVKKLSLLENISKIEIGKRLIALKDAANYGDWKNFIKNNFTFSYTSATRYMKISRRFSEVAPVQPLEYFQQLALLNVPEGEEENFLDEMDKQGTPFKDMNKQQANEAVEDYKQKYLDAQKELEAARADVDKEKSRADSLQGELDLFGDKLKSAEAKTRHFQNEFNSQLTKTQKAKAALEKFQKDTYTQNAKNTLLQDKLKADYEAKIKEKDNEINQLKNNPVTVEIVPEDYTKNKKALETAQNELQNLQQNFDSKVAEGVADKLAETQKSAEENAIWQFQFQDLLAKAKIIAANVDAVRAAVPTADRAKVADLLNDLANKICW